MNSRELSIAYSTIVRREVVRFLRIWRQTLVPPVITVTLYYLVFGHFIGQRIGEVHDMNYMAFIVPGLVMMNVIMNAFSHVVTSVFQAKFQKTIEEMLVSPMPYSVMIAGYVTGWMIRAILTGIIVFGVSFFFTAISVTHIFLALFLLFFTALLFALLGLINGLFAENFDSVSIIPNFVLTPLTYLWGVFYSVSMLPGIWQTLSWFNPILYIVDAFRFAVHGVSDISIVLSCSVIVSFCFGLFVVVWYMFMKGQGLRS